MPNCSKGWKNRCPAAKGKRCTCRCGGEQHGKARIAAPETEAPHKDPREIIGRKLGVD